MNYNSIYQKICERGKTRIKTIGVYLENHHIVPRCMGGTNEVENMTLLTAREHYIAHRLLCLMHSGNSISIRAKLSSAFNRMCTYNAHKRKYTSKQYAIARKYFSDNHPMKCPEIRNKVSETHRKRGLLCKEIRELSLPLCMCGCGERVKSKYSKYRYNHWDHSVTKKGFTREVRDNLSRIAKKRIKSLSENEKKIRLEKSLRSDKIDHVKRGVNISKGKKNKKTNQLEIMGKRFARMTNSEFDSYLQTKSFYVHTRYTNLRKKWMNILH
jgi:hypothetical protein